MIMLLENQFLNTWEGSPGQQCNLSLPFQHSAPGISQVGMIMFPVVSVKTIIFWRLT